MLVKFILPLLLISTAALAKTTFTYKGGESVDDRRQHYLQQVLTLALNKTVDEFGDFELVSTAEGLNLARVLRQLDEQAYSNFFVRVSMTDVFASKYSAVPFPIDRGVSGYRIALVQNGKEREWCGDEQINIEKYSIVQGLAWLDVDILRANNLQVYDSSSYDNMFEMINAGRMDMFFRSINEINDEYSIKSQNLKGLKIEPCIALYYPLPRFFITNKDNQVNAQRIYLGLSRAYKDGSFQTLWDQFFGQSRGLMQLKQRRIITLDNPFIKNLNKDYEQYNFVMSEYLEGTPVSK